MFRVGAKFRVSRETGNTGIFVFWPKHKICISMFETVRC